MPQIRLTFTQIRTKPMNHKKKNIYNKHNTTTTQKQNNFQKPWMCDSTKAKNLTWDTKNMKWKCQSFTWEKNNESLWLRERERRKLCVYVEERAWQRLYIRNENPPSLRVITKMDTRAVGVENLSTFFFLELNIM